MRAYNPLTVEELGRNAARALMRYPAVPLPPKDAVGSGIYTIHYHGNFHAYKDLADVPIYVGQTRNLRLRLAEHTRSVKQAENLNLRDFSCRWLVLEQVWIGLTEQTLIDEYRPLWNAIRGFGNHDQGSTRHTQQRSQWDTLHSGRPWASNQQDLDGGVDGVLAAIRRHLEEGSHAGNR